MPFSFFFLPLLLFSLGQIDEHSEVFAFLARALNLEFQS
jgi:hypothetical protein